MIWYFRRGIALFFFLCISHLSPLRGESDADFFENHAAQHGGSHIAKDFGRMLVSLVVLVAFAGGTLYVIKRYLRSKARHINSGSTIRIIERRALHQKASLYIIEVMGKEILIGESPAGIHLLTELPEAAPAPKEEEQKGPLSLLIEKFRSSKTPTA